jgi:hypothetical protein
MALPFPFTLRLRPDAAAFFCASRFSLSPELDHASAAGEQREPQPLIALCILDRVQGGNDGNATVEILRMSSAQAFPAVLAHAYCFSLRDTRRKQRMVQQYLDLVARVPTYIVRFRSGLEHLAAILDGIGQAVRSNGKE